jgi:hypothetical protein
MFNDLLANLRVVNTLSVRRDMNRRSDRLDISMSKNNDKADRNTNPHISP